MSTVERKHGLSDAGLWAMNIMGSVGIIMANKQVMSAAGYGFQFATTLTAMHFIVTSMVGYIGAALGYMPPKQLPFWDLFLFSFVSNISIVSMNLSLMLNSVGFYQISKLSMIPMVCFLEWFLHKKKYTFAMKVAIFVTMMGVGVCTVTNVHLNFSGLVVASIAIFTTSLQQIYIGQLQKKHDCGAIELLSKTAPIQAVFLAALGPFVDYAVTGESVFSYKFTSIAVLFIILSCSLAVLCNMSQYLCIGRFSTVTFQVLGHMKTVAVLILGWVLFDSVLTFKNMLGMVLTIVGMVLYESAKQEAANEANSLPRSTDFAKDYVFVPKNWMEQDDDGDEPDIELVLMNEK